MGGRVYTLNIREGEERRPGLTNLYSEEVSSLQPQYSVPARRVRRSLPSPPNTDTLTVILTRDSLSESKIYESLNSVSSSDQPEVPRRPSWSLQMPHKGRDEASPLYLVIPENQESSEGTKGVDIVDKEEGGQRQSVTEDFLNLMRRMSLSLGRSPTLDQLIPEEDSDIENDDVFC